MTETYNLYEAKTHLSKLLERASKGEEIIIAKAGKSLARLGPLVEKAAKPKRVPGLGKGKIWYTEDCFAPMSDEELKDWYGEDLPPLEDEKPKNEKK